MTNEIHFNRDKVRDSIYIEILEFSKSNGYQFQKFAIYDDLIGLQSLRNYSNIEDNTVQSIHKKTFRVIMHPGMPFLREKYDNLTMSQ